MARNRNIAPVICRGFLFVQSGANFSAPASGGCEANIAGLDHTGDAWQDKSYCEIVQFGRGAGRGILDEH
jgi:hypothetical protein